MILCPSGATFLPRPVVSGLDQVKAQIKKAIAAGVGAGSSTGGVKGGSTGGVKGGTTYGKQFRFINNSNYDIWISEFKINFNVN
jgi:hypothetical protein